jgi:hypothetical protein
MKKKITKDERGKRKIKIKRKRNKYKKLLGSFYNLHSQIKPLKP